MTEEIMEMVEKSEGAVDLEAVREFIERLFTLEQEVIGLREDRKVLKAEYKERIPMKMVSNIIKIVKAKLAIENASLETIEEVEDIVKDKIGMIID
jgi:hypothetical protein